MPDEQKSKLVTQTYGDVTLVFFVESRILDEKSIEGIAKELISLVDNTYKPKIILNFQGVNYLSSAVLSKLVLMHKKVQEAKGALKFCSIIPPIREVFRITKLDKVFEIFPDEAHALNSFKLIKHRI